MQFNQRNPAYQRAMAALAAQYPGGGQQNARVDELTSKFASQAGQREVQGQRIASQDKMAGQRFDLQKQMQAHQLGVGQQRLDMERQGLRDAAGQNRLATAIGVGTLGVTGLGGYKQIQEAKRTSALFDRMSKMLQQSNDAEGLRHLEVVKAMTDILKSYQPE